jgi:hypothetical protein
MESKKTANNFSPELRARAVREHLPPSASAGRFDDGRIIFRPLCAPSVRIGADAGGIAEIDAGPAAHHLEPTVNTNLKTLLEGLVICGPR